MTGHIAGLGYSQRMSNLGVPLAGCLLYVYASGTSTPVTTYTDYASTIEHPHPIVADAAGVIPMFWVADGTYRVRLTDAQGNEIFDDSGIVALGPSSGSAAAGSSVDSEALFATGWFDWQPITGTRSGWVRANARTVGAAASGATERANADVETLFSFLWNNYSDTLCPVTGGRGGSAAADWSANKKIATLDMRGCTSVGLDDMGNTAASIITANTPTAAASSGGAETVTIVGANLSSTLSFSSTALTGVLDGEGITNGTTIRRGGTNVTIDTPTGQATGGSESNILQGSTSVTLTIATSTVTIGGTVRANTGSVVGANKMPPYRLGTWYIKL